MGTQSRDSGNGGAGHAKQWTVHSQERLAGKLGSGQANSGQCAVNSGPKMGKIADSGPCAVNQGDPVGSKLTPTVIDPQEGPNVPNVERGQMCQMWELTEGGVG